MNKELKAKILIIIPAWNEAENLQSLLPEIRQHCPFADVLLMDDGSSDETAQIGIQHNATVMSFQRSGLGKTMRAGYRHAFENGYTIAVQVDGDGQHDPRRLPELVRPIINDKADCVIGSRYMKETPDQSYKTPLLRRMGMYYSRVLLFLICGVWINDTTSGFRAVGRKALEFLQVEYPVDHPEAGTLLALIRAGFRVIEVPTHMRPRNSGRSMFTLGRSILYPLHTLFGLIKIYLGTRRVSGNP